MKLIELIKTDKFVDFKFKEDHDDHLYSTTGNEVNPSEIYNHEYDCYLSLSSIIEMLDKEVIITGENND